MSDTKHYYIRRDFEFNYEKYNCVHRKYELMCVIVNENGRMVNKYKQADGIHTYNELPFLDTIPDFFRICGVYVHLNGVEAYMYNDVYKTDLKQYKKELEENGE